MQIDIFFLFIYIITGYKNKSHNLALLFRIYNYINSAINQL